MAGRPAVSNDAMHITNIVIPTGVSQNRNIASVAQVHPGTDATNSATWTVGEAIKHIVIPPNMRYVINGGTAAAAKALLDAAGGIATTVAYGRTYTDSLEYTQESEIERLDMKSMSGADQTQITIEAWA